MAEIIVSMFRWLEDHPKVIVISFILCWPVTYSVLYGLWDGLSGFSLFDRIVFSVAIELLVLAAYVLLLSGIMSMRKKRQLAIDRTITIGRVFGPVVYSEVVVFGIGMIVKNTSGSESLLAFVSIFVFIIIIFAFIRLEIKQMDGESKAKEKMEH